MESDEMGDDQVDATFDRMVEGLGECGRPEVTELRSVLKVADRRVFFEWAEPVPGYLLGMLSGMIDDTDGDAMSTMASGDVHRRYVDGVHKVLAGIDRGWAPVDEMTEWVMVLETTLTAIMSMMQVADDEVDGFLAAATVPSLLCRLCVALVGELGKIIDG